MQISLLTKVLASVGLSIHFVATMALFSLANRISAEHVGWRCFHVFSGALQFTLYFWICAGRATYGAYAYFWNLCALVSPLVTLLVTVFGFFATFYLQSGHVMANLPPHSMEIVYGLCLLALAALLSALCSHAYGRERGKKVSSYESCETAVMI